MLHDTLQYVDVFLPNEREAKKTAGTDDLQEAIEKLSETVPLVVVKRGSEGALARRGQEEIKLSPIRVESVDPVGAGDSFDAGFLHQFVRGADLRSCLRYGNLAGALSTTRPGGTEAFRDRRHFQDFFQRFCHKETRDD
jgi:sugar/nucleoside kinase (ribokinase family)